MYVLEVETMFPEDATVTELQKETLCIEFAAKLDYKDDQISECRLVDLHQDWDEEEWLLVVDIMNDDVNLALMKKDEATNAMIAITAKMGFEIEAKDVVVTVEEERNNLLTYMWIFHYEMNFTL